MSFGEPIDADDLLALRESAEQILWTEGQFVYSITGDTDFALDNLRLLDRAAWIDLVQDARRLNESPPRSLAMDALNWLVLFPLGWVASIVVLLKRPSSWAALVFLFAAGVIVAIVHTPFSMFNAGLLGGAIQQWTSSRSLNKAPTSDAPAP